MNLARLRMVCFGSRQDLRHTAFNFGPSAGRLESSSMRSHAEQLGPEDGEVQRPTVLSAIGSWSPEHPLKSSRKKSDIHVG